MAMMSKAKIGASPLGLRRKISGLLGIFSQALKALVKNVKNIGGKIKVKII